MYSDMYHKKVNKKIAKKIQGENMTKFYNRNV